MIDILVSYTCLEEQGVMIKSAGNCHKVGRTVKIRKTVIISIALRPKADTNRIVMLNFICMG